MAAQLASDQDYIKRRDATAKAALKKGLAKASEALEDSCPALSQAT
jgi:hypothetical protein